MSSVEARLQRVEFAMADNRAKVEEIDQHVDGLEGRHEEFHGEIQGALNSLAESWKAQLDALKDSFQVEIVAIRDELKEVNRRKANPSHPLQATTSSIKIRGAATSPSLHVFLCDGNYFSRDCPKRAKLSALIQDEDEEPHHEETKMGSLRLLNAIKAKIDVAKATKKGHMYVEVKVRGFNTRALVDTGASHNFIEVKEAKRQGLQFKEEQGWIKAANLEARRIYGVARDVWLHIGNWCGQWTSRWYLWTITPLCWGWSFWMGCGHSPSPSPKPCASWAREMHVCNRSDSHETHGETPHEPKTPGHRGAWTTELTTKLWRRASGGDHPNEPRLGWTFVRRSTLSETKTGTCALNSTAAKQGCSFGFNGPHSLQRTEGGSPQVIARMVDSFSTLITRMASSIRKLGNRFTSSHRIHGPPDDAPSLGNDVHYVGWSHILVHLLMCWPDMNYLPQGWVASFPGGHSEGQIEYRSSFLFRFYHAYDNYMTYAFPCNIRVLGGLVSAHILATDSTNSYTSLMYMRSLEIDILGSLILEMGALSRLTGDPSFKSAALRALRAGMFSHLWSLLALDSVHKVHGSCYFLGYFIFL
ncbi:glycosyl hydrolase family 47 protein [Actinidia rufa]|uniref:Glycosyl hydrolase family 47 protein n=1 Tax=Actinidia rufa TaxID=165716 RepID=A0A7J0DEQ0_9ERIC|nr:glycosyl hydrolase family 47 protein [Actinidia rufa]